MFQALNHQRHTDKWWETEYSENIHSYLQYHEVKWRMVYGARSPQVIHNIKIFSHYSIIYILFSQYLDSFATRVVKNH